MRTSWEFLSKHFSTVEQFKDHAVFLASVDMYQKKFKLGTHAMYPADVFLFNHGLSDCDSSVLDYIAGKTFIDGGAYIGDSALMFQAMYSPGLVISFDPSIRNTARYKINMVHNKIKTSKFIVEHAALGEKDVPHVLFRDADDQTSLLLSGYSDTPMYRLDTYLAQLNKTIPPIGFIKLDVEGYGVRALRGMETTIQKHRPVLSLSIYHSPEELFETKKVL